MGDRKKYNKPSIGDIYRFSKHLQLSFKQKFALAKVYKKIDSSENIVLKSGGYEYAGNGSIRIFFECKLKELIQLAVIKINYRFLEDSKPYEYILFLECTSDGDYFLEVHIYSLYNDQVHNFKIGKNIPDDKMVSNLFYRLNFDSDKD